MEKSLLIAGFGGQGIMLIGKMLGFAASKAGMNATFYPSYGAEQRGGTANCTVIIGDDEIGSPVSRRLDTLIAMNEPSFVRFVDRMKKGGVVIVNSSLVQSKVEDKDVKAFYIPANDLAQELGSVQVANIIVLGAYIAATGILDAEFAKQVIAEQLGRKPEMLELNMQAFDKGMAAVK
jgi:2-oxoglutarate ferredoxin oxidoreductase subunit gamma